MQRPIKLLVLVTVLSAASVFFGHVGAAGIERLALQELVPPAINFAADASSQSTEMMAGLPQQPGLKLPRQATSRGDDVFDVISRDAGGSLLYSGTRTMQHLGAEYSQAFGGLRYPLSGSWVSSLEASVDAALPASPRGYSLLGQVQRSLPGGWDLSLGLQVSTYQSSAYRLQAGAGDTWNPLNQRLPLYSSGTGASAAAGYELRLRYRYGERNTFGLSYGSGREFDPTRQMFGIQPGDGRQFGVTGQHWLTPDWALRYGLMAQEQVGLYRGQGLRLGLRYSF